MILLKWLTNNLHHSSLIATKHSQSYNLYKQPYNGLNKMQSQFSLLCSAITCPQEPTLFLVTIFALPLTSILISSLVRAGSPINNYCACYITKYLIIQSILSYLFLYCYYINKKWFYIYIIFVKYNIYYVEFGLFIIIT